MQNTLAKEKGFFEVFGGISDDEGICNYFKHATLEEINLYKKSGNMELEVASDILIPAQIIEKAEQAIMKFFNLEQTSIKIKFNLITAAKEAVEEYWENIVCMINKKVALSRGILTGSKCTLRDRTLVVSLENAGSEVLSSRQCDTIIENILEECFSLKVRVVFEDPVIDDGVKNRYIEDKQIEEERVVAAEIPTVKYVKRTAVKSKTTSDEKNRRIILGKDFDEPLVKIADINQDFGRAAICGDVIKVEFRELRGGKHLCRFDVTDYTSSITVKFFAKKDKLDSLIDGIKEGICVKVLGEVQYDKFEREHVISAFSIVEVEKYARCDNAPVKRVELHLHTQMSSMDAITHVSSLIDRAAQWGHKAVAVTDHGVVQAFPEAAEAAKKHGIKVIYGMECYLVDSGVCIVQNPCSYSLDEDFIIFDIETTGLNPYSDRITEIGAVRLKNGQAADEFSTLVNPGIPIPESIANLTGITDEMVKDSPSIDEVIPELLEFFGNLPVVAHNAGFDMGFLSFNAHRLGLKVCNPVIDTLELSRRLIPKLKRHKLNTVAEHLGIKLEKHHRAVEDCRTLGGIFTRFIAILKEKGIDNILDINKALDYEESYKKAPTFHAVILARDYVGLKNLYHLVSYSHLDYFYKKPRIPKKLLEAYRNGLLIGSACEAGELFTAIINNKSDKEIEDIAKFYDYLEIQPLGNNHFLLDEGRLDSEEELKEINLKITKLGERLSKPVVATCDVHFMDEKDEVFRRILMGGQGYSDADRQAPLFFRTTDEMLEEFDYLGSEKAYEVVVENTNTIAGLIDEITPIPNGTFTPEIEGAEEEIKALAEGRAKEIYGDALPAIVRERLDKELNSIIKNGFSVMYLIAQKLVSKSLEDGYLVGSRGSVGSSFVANMVGITEVNSLPPHYICQECRHSEFITDRSAGCGFDLPPKTCPKCGKEMKRDGYDIPFETFLGFDGDKEPDIDLNFSGEYQPHAHRYTEELFGKGHVFRAGTISTIAEKTAFGFVKNYLDERNIVVTNAEINRLVKGCAGIKRTTGQHPGGVMIVPKGRDIFEFCPIQRPADDTNSDIITTHFDYHSISGRLLKLDILGHDDPTVIKMLEDLTGIDARSILIGEKKTMGIFSSTEPLGVSPEEINSEVGTFGIPEFGTKFVRQMLVDTRPTTFAELVRISGLSHGTDVWLNNAQDLIRSNTASLSEVICTRDDIMNYLIHKSMPPKTAFKIMEDVRKGKGLKDEYVEIMKACNVPQWYIDSCKKIKYMFPKAHAAAYVMMAFRIAWFKVYYPEAFYVTYFTVRADEFDADLMIGGQEHIRNKIRELEQKGSEMTQKEKNVLTILEVGNEMCARGIKFLPVDLYKSDAFKFQITPQGIRPPLNTLQGLGITAAQGIVDARMDGEFISLDDLRIRAKVSKAVVEILQKHGCLDGLPESNQISIFN